MSVTPNSVVTPQAVNASFQSFVNADGTTKKLLFTAGASGSILDGLIAQSTDSAARNILLYIYDGATYWPIGCVNIPITSGDTGAIASVNLLSPTLIPGLPVDANGNPYLKIKSGQSVYGAMLVAVTVALQITVTALGEDY